MAEQHTWQQERQAETARFPDVCQVRKAGGTRLIDGDTCSGVVILSVDAQNRQERKSLNAQAAARGLVVCRDSVPVIVVDNAAQR